MSISIASDYAALKAGKFSFYYGYEQTVCKAHAEEECQNCEWAFVAKQGNRELMRLGWRQLPASGGQYEVTENLIAGLGVFIANHAGPIP